MRPGEIDLCSEYKAAETEARTQSVLADQRNLWLKKQCQCPPLADLMKVRIHVSASSGE